MATINGIPMAEARLRGEQCNATDYTWAEMTAWILEDGPMSWMDRARPITIRLTLRPGCGSESHLFDRSAARVAEAVEGRLFASTAEAQRAVQAVPTRESLQYSVEVEEGNYHQEVPAGLEAAAEAIRERLADADAAKRRQERVRFVRSLSVYQSADGMYRVTTADSHSRGHWVDGVGGRYWYCEGLDSRSSADYVGICGPNRGYATESEAAAALAAVRTMYGI